jgi:large subunit ribosomal protein L15
MPLQRRLPKRGFHPFRKLIYQEVNIRDLERFPDAMEYDPVSMRELGLIKSSKKPVKILGCGEISRKVQIKAHAFTNSAREKITAAGGVAEVL